MIRSAVAGKPSRTPRLDVSSSRLHKTLLTISTTSCGTASNLCGACIEHPL